jgi:GT2 family glycosyltransferase/glycosyltransferase involved in cell wall biosynthesis
MDAAMSVSPPDTPKLSDIVDERTINELRGFLDVDWYLQRYPDLRALKLDPLTHYILYGAAEGRDPNRYFDSAWYVKHYPDVVTSGFPPLLHYLKWGPAERRNPHPRFDAVYYVEMHPEAASNPLLFHIRVGAARGWPIERPVDIAEYLPSQRQPLSCPDGVTVDVVIAAYRGLRETQLCLNSVLDDPDRPPGQVIVVDDCSPEPRLVAWLQRLAAEGRITLLRNRRNAGFVSSVNRGMEAADGHDVALLNSDTVVPHGWLHRLAAQAYSRSRVATVSPFSNNATICGYPSISGGPPAFGLDVHQLDATCRTINAGRSVEVPTTVGFCMYIRRAALNDVGAFDDATFGLGYGEENDFCLRAAERGWRHLLACDTYVFHKGNVSFGASAGGKKQRALDALDERYPEYAAIVARHVWLAPEESARFALTAALLRASGQPVVMMISHQLGGGVQRHVDELTARLAGTAHVLMLSASAGGVGLSVPSLPGHPAFRLAGERIDDLVTYLRTVPLARVHIHHILGMDLDLTALLRRLGVGYDITVHDYFAICPQVNLMQGPQQNYCGEPGPAVCNACIAHRPNYGAREILAWRRTQARLFLAADRVLCPSEDVKSRLERYGLGHNIVLAPHEKVDAKTWTLRPVRPAAGQPLQVAVIGVLAGHKGEVSIISLAETAAEDIALHLIGYPERELPASVAARIKISGEYEEHELPGLLARARPHVVWFPAQWPETYSYTLTAAIDAGLPIVATRIGAFPERLQGRKLTWLVDPAATTAEWLKVFQEVRTALGRPPGGAVARRPVADFYAADYAAPLRMPPPRVPPMGSPPVGSPPVGVPKVGAPAVQSRVLDLRRPGRLSIAVIPERSAGGALSPCAYIRLLQPLDHPAIAGDFDVVFADEHDITRLRTDIVATQRYAIAGTDGADALAAHCRETGARLLYDIDDDLLHIPRDHPEAAELRPRARVIARMLRHADVVWTSTAPLAAALRDACGSIRVVPNGLDERIWGEPGVDRVRLNPLRILFMGSATHQKDWAVVAAALGRVVNVFGGDVMFDMMGVVGPVTLPDWVHRVAPSMVGNASYPGFVDWITHAPPWDIGIAALADTDFNRCKSAIKLMDYAALGLPVVASDVPAYRAALTGSGGGLLVANTGAAWFEALCRLVRDAQLRKRLAAAGAKALVARDTLAAQAATRRAAWGDVVGRGDGKATRRRNVPLAAN